MRMPTKNVYVSDADLPLFDQAAELAGALSAAVSAGLRLYVAQQTRNRKDAEMSVIELEVDEGSIVTTKRFTGRQILRYRAQEGLRTKRFRVYLTAKGQYAVYVRNEPDWAALTRSGDEDDEAWNDPHAWDGDWWSSGSRTMHVFPDLDSMHGQLPDGIVEALARTHAQPSVEDLDI